jgi:EAL and modified HD-GYP domain-containing signal transduction protein
LIKSYLARQAIVDINQNIVAYELLFRDTKIQIQTMPTSTVATATCLFALFESGEIKNIVPDGIKAFINVDHNVLKARIVDKLNPEKFVIELLEYAELDQCEDIIRKLHSDRLR